MLNHGTEQDKVNKDINFFIETHFKTSELLFKTPIKKQSAFSVLSKKKSLSDRSSKNTA